MKRAVAIEGRQQAVGVDDGPTHQEGALSKDAVLEDGQVRFENVELPTV